MILTSKVNSSMIQEVQYNPEELILTVMFNKGGAYDYRGVTEAIHEELIKAPSVGKFFHSNIKGKYETIKHAVEEDEDF